MTLAEQLENYLTVRQHTLSTAHLSGADQFIAEAEYILGEAQELLDAVNDLFMPATVDVMACVRHELADVVLAATCLAGMFGVTVEDCIAEKTEADRGRG
jgi:NTP pyrophosphatase (non-canonical NTP hydrolase)